MTKQMIMIPDIGADSAEVTEILVKVGDSITLDQSIVVLESDKASVEVPAALTGKVTAIKVKIGDTVSEGMPLLELETETKVESATKEGESKKDADTKSTDFEKMAVPQKASPVSAATSQQYTVPDIGSDSAEVIEVSVKVGDQVSEGDTIVVAESDKASLEVPAEASGTVEALHVSTGSKISQGMPLVTLNIVSEMTALVQEEVKPAVTPPAAETAKSSTPISTSTQTEQTFLVPDIGSDTAEVIEVSVQVGDQVDEGDTLVVAESDKASLEVPAETAGVVVSLHAKVGDKISQGNKLVTLSVASKSAVDVAAKTKDAPATVATTPVETVNPTAATIPVKALETAVSLDTSATVYAGPAVRKLARELGVDLSKVTGTGARSRISKEDVHAYVKQRLQSSSSGVGVTEGIGIPSIPALDWSQFGKIRIEPMSRIHKMTAANMVRNWLNVPHVTQFDDADVTDIEEYRNLIKHEGDARGIKMTPLAFLLKASASALRENPKFNSSLHENGNDLVFREFIHIGIAVDTPKGLMVPVIRDVDQKDIWQLAKEVADFAQSSRDGKLKPQDMQGASFTISSLGPMGGRGFTPIVSAPQVAILGVSKTTVQPVWNGKEFVPRKMLPLAVSYDHRAVNGADAGKFMTYLVEQLGSVKNMWS